MALNGWSAGCWQRWRAWFVPATRLARRPRRRRDPFFAIAAQVEQLESRQLLTVTYHGGALLPNVEVQAVYLGSDWQNTAALQTQEGQINSFLPMIVQSSYMDMMTSAGYNVGRGTATAGVIDNITLNKSTGITDAQIQADVQAMINSGQLQAPDANRLYVVYVEPGVVIHAVGGASNSNFLGYHGAFAGKAAGGVAADIHYAVISYPGAPNFSSASQGFSSDLDEMTAVTSHELAEAVTDPNVNYKALGWYDDQNNGEIGDLAEGNYAVLNGFLVQDLVDQNDQLISPMSQTPPPSGLSAPVVTATAMNSTIAQLTWNAVSGAQGYNVYQIVGSQSLLLGTTTSTTVQITGLTPGTTASFVVEAYNGTTTADSQVASVTMPKAVQGLSSPHLTATAQSSTTVLLQWTPVSGAQGYRIYWWNGTQAVLLGTVGPRHRSVQIVNLQPGSTNQFLIEAYAGRKVGDSAWVAVTTPGSSAADPLTAWAALHVGTNRWKHDDWQWPN